MNPLPSVNPPSGDTKSRILDASEVLFIEFGFDAMSLRQITACARVNLAAVNYHFGNKEMLLQAMLSRRLDRLNNERLMLLTYCEAAWPGETLSCEHVLGAMFIPALSISRDPAAGGPAFLRLLGRVYADPSPFINAYLQAHYAPVFERFFQAFARALPQLSQQALRWRLHFALQALAGALVDVDTTTDRLSHASPAPIMDTPQVIAQLIALMTASLQAPAPSAKQIECFTAVSALAARINSASLIFTPHVSDDLDQPTASPPATVPPNSSTNAYKAQTHQNAQRRPR